MDGDDDNEGACGACKRVGELLCCDGCPAAFHIRCAGYESQSEVPEGEWYCWFCAKERSLPYQHPTNVFKPPRASTQTVMLATDDTAEVFYRCRTVAVSDDYVELQYLDMQREDEIVHRGSTRLWHGTTDKHAWTLTAKDAYRPNCRLFQVDKEAMAAAVAAARSHKQQQQQQRLAVAKQSSLRVTSPAAADAAGVQRIPAGEVGAGLPVVVGGASEAEFEAALHALWRSLLGPAYPERMPACQLMGGQAVGAWQLWREVWAWGGPDVVSRHKLWATVGFAFNVSVTCTSVSSRIKKSYDSVIEPLDQAIDEGAVTLQRPTPSRQPGDRALQLRNVPSGNGGAAAAAPASRPDLQPRRPVGRPRGSKNKRKRAAAGSGSRSGKRRRGAWSSEDDDDPAPDMGSEFDSEEGDDDADDDGDINGLLGSDGSEDELSEEAGSGEESEGGSPSRKMARTVASMRAARAAAPHAAAAAAADGREPPGAMKFAVGKPVLTPAARQLQVGQLVDFRQWQQGVGCATGWRSGTVLAIEPGSIWEGGSRLLVQPRHPLHHSSGNSHHSSSHHHHHHHPAGSPAAAALAAVAAAGLPAAGEAGATAASKLLTSRGHLRHEVAGLLQQQVPFRPGSPGLSRPHMGAAAGAAGAAAVSPRAQRQQHGTAAAAAGVGSPRAAEQPGSGAAAAAGGAPDAAQQQQDDSSRPAWVPLLYRGAAQQPLQQPLVMVRPHYVPSAAAAAASSAAVTSAPPPELRPAASAGASPFLLQQQQPQASGQHVFSLKPSPNMLVEALHQGCWWPAKVLSVKPASQQDEQQQQAAAAAASAGLGPGISCSSEPSSSVSYCAAGGSSSCVVLRNLEPPEADGLVWKCSMGHSIRPCHPQHGAGLGVLAATQDDVLPLSQLRKQVLPYAYAGGIQAYACLSHLADARRG